MRFLTDDVFIAALTVREYPAQITLCSSGHEQSSFKAQHVSDFFLQMNDAGIIAQHIIAQWGRNHGFTHACRRQSNGITTQIN
jgi:hypothetical protein